MRAEFGHRPDQAPPQAVAAALVALFEEDAVVRVVLIRRAFGLSANPGEMAFPGGKVEPGETMVGAALREAEEEVGLAPAAVEVVGWLDPVVGRTSGSVVLPVVGLLRERPALVPAVAEVDAVTDVALSDLAVCCTTERWDDRDMYFFDLDEDVVWGLTARALYQLLCRLTGRTGPPAGAPARAPEATSRPAPS